MFESLIDTGLEANTDKEYLYLLHMAWPNNSLKSEPIKFGTVVYAVTDKSGNNHRGYWFVTKDTDKLYHSNYPWVFAENTPENQEKIDKYLAHKKQLDDMKLENKRLWDDIVTLQIKD